ncbi:hypothetical protein KUDE01_014980 [Dissostichus eleginoides]|uniref:Uncharacterized protein n=1 Tax=Dissostichus eleginoides TaxID=100907 RepID=A0AAD9BYQ2_DISEL|nr:hypothetical protein KUDE01_014980 [Dissostichus eleginoides]
MSCRKRCKREIFKFAQYLYRLVTGTLNTEVNQRKWGGFIKDVLVFIWWTLVSLWVFQGEERIKCCCVTRMILPVLTTQSMYKLQVKDTTSDRAASSLGVLANIKSRFFPPSTPHSSAVNCRHQSLSAARRGWPCRKWSSISIILQTDPPLAPLLTWLTLCQCRAGVNKRALSWATSLLEQNQGEQSAPTLCTE